MKGMLTMNESGTTSREHTWETVDRVVYPIHDQDLTLPLYAIPWVRPHLTDDVFNPRLNMEKLSFDSMNATSFRHLVNESVESHSSASTTDVFTVDDRSSLTIRPGKHVSLCTFFNAFPASYWKRWTAISMVRFSAEVRGTGELVLYRSTGRGLFSPVTTLAVDTSNGKDFAEVETTITMNGLLDGGYFWFDAQAGLGSELTVRDAQWSVPSEERTAKADTTLSVAITTFNRTPYCLHQLQAIAHEPALRRRLDTIYCTDQGTTLVRDEPGFDEVSAELGDQLTYLRQTNMGGSAGFSRGMYETLKAGSSAYTLLLDDDAISEPEAILRAVQFADYAKHPTIVGGGMFHLDNRTVLYTQGERFDASSVWMKPSQGLGYNHDFARFPLRDSPERHRRIDSDFNGWWMCLIPTAIMKTIGLSMPFFIKFDDTEYALRAAEHGFHTVCLPGVAVWHQAWHDKDPSRTWEEYFFQRNRWICGLLHCPQPSRRFRFEMLYGDINVGLKLVYSALRLRHMGLQDILRGPEYIVESMPRKMAEVRKAREGFADTTLAKDLDDFPKPIREFDRRATPRASRDIKKAGLHAIVGALLSRGNGTKDERPDIAIPADQAIWRSFNGVNSALVTSPDGSTAAWCRRDSRLFRKQIRQGLRLSHTLIKQWGALSNRYREYDMASIDVWSRIFAAETIDDSTDAAADGCSNDNTDGLPAK
jgi:galactofuranosylgalactofuranosylrhamnosyl-N-acetylglucosaminyl-diphospho-decaprenol beta-1,5/1,6-galactofuranosyltransferase